MIRYTAIFVCPKTGREVSKRGRYYNKGICEVCGHADIGTVDHSHKEVGYWKYPANRSWYEFWIKPTWVQKRRA